MAPPAAQQSLREMVAGGIEDCPMLLGGRGASIPLRSRGLPHDAIAGEDLRAPRFPFSGPLHQGAAHIAWLV